MTSRPSRPGTWVLAVTVPLLLTLVAGVTAAPTSAEPTVRYTVNTFPSTDGDLCCFGGETKHTSNPVQTLGEVVHLPADAAVLHRFAFRMYADKGMRFRAYVMKWRPRLHRAGGHVLWRSPVRKSPATERRTYWFRTHRLELVPGHRYVLFVSVAQIKRHSAKSASAFVADESYKRGFGVYQGNKYEPEKWTNHRWGGGDFDMSFRMVLTN